MPSNNKLTMTIPEVASLLGISRGLAYDLAKREKLPGLIRLGEKRIVCSRLIIERLLTGQSLTPSRDKVEDNNEPHS